MNETITAVDAHLEEGDFPAAWGEFRTLPEDRRLGLEGLMLSMRIHFAAKGWKEVDVLCGVLRKEHPNDMSGFMLGAESLCAQGRISDAIELLMEWPRPESEPVVMAAIKRCQVAKSFMEKQIQ